MAGSKHIGGYVKPLLYYPDQLIIGDEARIRIYDWNVEQGFFIAYTMASSPLYSVE